MPNKYRSRGRRSQAEAERTRGRLLRCAEKLFAAKGYRGVSVREVARAAGVQNFTVQAHFGSKLDLYRTLLSRWDEEIRGRVSQALLESTDVPSFIERVVEDIFEFMVANRRWVTLWARARLGEGIPTSDMVRDHGWMHFMSKTVAERKMNVTGVDLRLLLISLEGILNNHVLADAHYRHLFGTDLNDTRTRELTKAHLKRLILAIVGGQRSAPASGARRSRSRRGA